MLDAIKISLKDSMEKETIITVYARTQSYRHIQKYAI